VRPTPTGATFADHERVLRDGADAAGFTHLLQITAVSAPGEGDQFLYYATEAEAVAAAAEVPVTGQALHIDLLVFAGRASRDDQQRHKPRQRRAIATQPTSRPRRTRLSSPSMTRPNRPRHCAVSQATVPPPCPRAAPPPAATVKMHRSGCASSSSGWTGRRGGPCAIVKLRSCGRLCNG
jgi:hypothetical protein